MNTRDADTVTAYQTMQAYWNKQYLQVMLWLETYPDNAAGKYDACVYQRRAASSYKCAALIRGF